MGLGQAMERTRHEVVTYAELGERIRGRTTSKRVPLYGSLELTYRCNLRCAHCYLDGQHESPPELQELSTEEIFDIVDQIVNEGCLFLLLTGGEPLVRPDWREIYLYAKRKGLLVTLFTNGTRIREEDAELLAEWPPVAVEISLYGATAETYERITGIAGSYTQCIRGIQSLIDHSVPFRLKTPLMTLNKQELRSIQLFSSNIGGEHRYDPILRPAADGDLTPYQFRLQPQEIAEIEQSDPRKVQSWEKECEGTSGQKIPSGYLYNCRAGIESFHINPWGKVSLCLDAREPTYDLRRGDFHQAWTEFIPEVRYALHSSDYICGECDLRALCPQCPVLSKMEFGDPEHPSTYLCKLTHRRANVTYHSIDQPKHPQPCEAVSQ
jgi:radical SAM protein with 4Fe4S-binding SPASM domain